MHVIHLELSLVLSIWSIHVSCNDGGDDGDNDAAGGDVSGHDNDVIRVILGSFFLPIKQNLEIHSSLVIYMEKES